jgi:phosphoglucosamine mutase
MIEEGQPLSRLAATMNRYPQVLLNFEVAEKRPIEDMPAVQRAIAAAQGALGADGRVLVRYSGTEKKARVMIEGMDENLIRSHAEQIADTLKQAVSG